MKHSLLPAAGLTAAMLASSAAAPAAGTAPARGRDPAAAHGTVAASPAPGSTTAVLTLPTGDRVLARMAPGGPGTVSVLGRPGSRRATSLMTVHTGGRDLVIPLAALPYLGHGLDPSLFDTGALAHAERGGRLPVTLHYRGDLDAPPGITVTHTGAGTANGYLTASSAARFGAALARQLVADHGRGSYGSDGVFAGGLSVSLPGAHPAATAAGPRLHTLTATGTNLAGKPDTGDIVDVENVGSPGAPGTGLAVFHHGTATFSVPAGTYWAVGMFAQLSSSGRITAARMDVLPQFTVSGNTTVHTSSRAATSKVTMLTPRRAITRSSTLTVVRAAPHSPASGPTAKVSSQGLTAINVPLWVSPVNRRPGFGTLRAFTSGQLTSPPGPGVPYGYTLDFVDPPGTIPSQHFTVHPADLATISERYFQDRESVAGWETLGGTLYQMRTSFTGALVLPLRLPGRQVQYLSAKPAMLWTSEYAEYDRTFPGQTAGGQTGALRLLHAGQRLTESWNRYPLHPGVNVDFAGNRVFAVRASAARTGNTLRLDLTPFTDNQRGHTGSGLAAAFPGKDTDFRGSFALYQNGLKIAGGDAVKATGGFGDVQVSKTLSPKPSVIKFVLNASRAGQRFLLSATSRDVWTWHSRREPGAALPRPWLCGFTTQPVRKCAVQPMMTVGYRVAGLSLTGTTRPGHQALTIAAGHIQLARQFPVARGRVQVSFNDGRTWRRARVRPLPAGRFRATFAAPPSAHVTLRVTARDAAGNTLTETILRAYRTSA